MSATEQARALVIELIKSGVTDLVIAPGSRNGPISLAALAAADANLLNVAVRIDERSAAFTALGIAKVSKSPVAVVVTSGTAGAHLLPALIEADQSDIKLIAITADRPAALVNTGANQTIEQLNLFNSVTEVVVDLDSDWPAAKWQHELAVALNSSGVIHLNPRFAEPLKPDSVWQVPKIEISVENAVAKSVNLNELINNKCGVVISDAQEIKHAAEIARKLNWPLITEPAGMAGANLIKHGPIAIAKLADQVEIVVSCGRVGLARTTNALLNSKPRIAVKLPKSINRANAIYASCDQLDLSEVIPTDQKWLKTWQDNANAISTKIDELIDNTKLSGLDVAQSLFTNLTKQNHLHVAASLSLRDLDFMMQENEIGLITVNRGVNGIDGVIASATGAAIAWQRTGGEQSYCLLGDVAFLHDLSSLAIPATESLPNLRLIVVDNNGGGVFSTVEQHGATGFERVFGTPHKVNLENVLTGLGITVTKVESKSDLANIFIDKPGISAVLISNLDREQEAKLRREVVNLAH